VAKKRNRSKRYFKNDLKFINSLTDKDFDTQDYEDLSNEALIYFLPRSVSAVIRVNHSNGTVAEHSSYSYKETHRVLHRIRDSDPKATILVMDQDQMFQATFTQ
jgi:hypothetical protein